MDFADEFVNMKRELRDLKTYVPRNGGGEPGPPGEAATVTVGSTTTGAAGTNASVTNSGDTHNAILNFTIPRGNTGATGSAATVAVGTTSTLPAGSSATVSNSGTSSAAVLNFGIPKGDTGATGSAATVSVGTTSTLPAGSSATVTNSGSSSAAVLNFGIPTGAQGPTGADGQDGYSPSATVTQTSTGATITITDKDGTTTANIYNGSSGSSLTSFYINGSTVYGASALYKDQAYTTAATYDDVVVASANGEVELVTTEGSYRMMSFEDFSNQTPKIAVISVVGTDSTSNMVKFTLSITDQGSVGTSRYRSQNKLTAGSNITISGNTISATDTIYGTFTGATSSQAGTFGLVPAPAAGDNTKFLAGDGTWKVDSGSTISSGVGTINSTYFTGNAYWHQVGKLVMVNFNGGISRSLPGQAHVTFVTNLPMCDSARSFDGSFLGADYGTPTKIYTCRIDRGTTELYIVWPPTNTSREFVFQFFYFAN